MTNKYDKRLKREKRAINYPQLFGYLQKDYLWPQGN